MSFTNFMMPPILILRMIFVIVVYNLRTCVLYCFLYVYYCSVIMYVWIVLCVFCLYVYVYVCACMYVPPMRKSGCADHLEVKLINQLINQT